jgi:hypothetical protein
MYVYMYIYMYELFIHVNVYLQLIPQWIVWVDIFW